MQVNRPAPWGARLRWQNGLSSLALKMLDNKVQFNFNKRGLSAIPSDMIIAETYRTICDGHNEYTSLYRYILPDGTEYHEDIQVEFDGSGLWRCFALKNQGGHWLTDTLWSDAEIESAKQELETVDWIKISRVIKY